MLRRTLIKFLIASPLSIFTSSLLANDENLIEVWKSPTCGCCKDWIIHLESNGFKVVYYDTGNNRVRHQVGMPRKYGSCHTAIIGGYVIEGHVPASDILKLIDLQSNAIGLSVPGCRLVLRVWMDQNIKAEQIHLMFCWLPKKGIKFLVGITRTDRLLRRPKKHRYRHALNDI